MITPTQKRRLEGGIAALRENHDRGPAAKSVGMMKDGYTGGRCCLRVLYDYAQERGAELGICGPADPPPAMYDWYGLEQAPVYEVDHVRAGLPRHNDGLRSEGFAPKTHGQIADGIEAWLEEQEVSEDS